MLILVISGAGCYLPGIFGGAASSSWIGSIFFLLAAVAGLMTTTWLRRDAKRMSAELDMMSREGKYLPVRAGSREFSRLCGSLNGLVDSADARVQEANLKLKSLEIELKVATAERQHAQAIIYSISDAVLVTDPFDDVVLANESAARTFEFDLGRAPRTPVRQLLHDPKMIELIRQVRQGGGRGGRRVVEHQVRSGDELRTYQVTLSAVTEPPQPGAATAGTAATAATSLPAADVEPPGVVAVLHDVTHEREIAQLKNDFVSNVSHELR